jgi:predicted nucleic acid-binding protein
MILADTSLWIQHLRVGHPAFKTLLDRKRISVHWVVIGELATGNLPRRGEFLAMIRVIPLAKTGSSEECLRFIEDQKLHGRGLGWNDVQLLVAARLSGNPLWTLDTRLAAAATALGVGYPAP